MKEIISNKMFIAYATPIVGVDKYGYYEYADGSEYFIINPIVRKNMLGKEKIVGAVETISKIKLFNCYSLDNITYVFEDIESSKYNIGGIKWFANMKDEADKVLDKEELNNYFKQTPGNMLDKIIYVRKSFKEKSLNRTLKK